MPVTFADLIPVRWSPDARAAFRAVDALDVENRSLRDYIDRLDALLSRARDLNGDLLDEASAGLPGKSRCAHLEQQNALLRSQLAELERRYGPATPLPDVVVVSTIEAVSQ